MFVYMYAYVFVCTCTCTFKHVCLYILFAVGQNLFPNSIVCGVVPLFEENDWKLVCTYNILIYVCTVCACTGTMPYQLNSSALLHTCFHFACICDMVIKTHSSRYIYLLNSIFSR